MIVITFQINQHCPDIAINNIKILNHNIKKVINKNHALD